MQQVGDIGNQAEDAAPVGTVTVAETEIVLRTANLEKAREEAANAEAE